MAEGDEYLDYPNETLERMEKLLGFKLNLKLNYYYKVTPSAPGWYKWGT